MMRTYLERVRAAWAILRGRGCVLHMDTGDQHREFLAWERVEPVDTWTGLDVPGHQYTQGERTPEGGARRWWLVLDSDGTVEGVHTDPDVADADAHNYRLRVVEVVPADGDGARR